jgi:hypothetical protein
MTTGGRIVTDERRYNLEELVGLRRKMLLYARSFPPGHERNQHRQTAMSLRDFSRIRFGWRLILDDTRRAFS